MLLSEIHALCDDTAQSTGLPIDWILYHVFAQVGKPCPRCGGSGIVLPGACFRCGGTGGRASHVGVVNALEWVKANAARVRALGEKRDAQAPLIEAAHARAALLAAETWKRDNADLWEFLEGLFDNEFKRSLVQAVEAGRISPNQEEALRKMLVAHKRRATPAPLVGTRVDVDVTITDAKHCADMRGHRVFRVDFESEIGWRGRIDVEREGVVDRLQGRQHDLAHVQGLVVWRKDNFAILSNQSDVQVRQ